MKHEALTSKILEAAFDVSNELGAGFLESVYLQSLMISLRARGLEANLQCPLEVRFQAQLVGSFFADIVVANLVILELKASREITPEHEAQILNYIKATGIPVGMLLNFGQSKLQFRRYDNRFSEK